MVVSEKKSSPVGESKRRLDAREKVTGAAIFGDDMQFGNALLHARILRSPHPHAKILSIDTKESLGAVSYTHLYRGDR